MEEKRTSDSTPVCCPCCIQRDKDGESHSLLLLHFVGGGEVIKQFAVHLHEGLQHVVDQRHDGPDRDTDNKSEHHGETL